MKNLFDSIPADLPGAVVAPLLRGGSFRVERIVSQGQASPQGIWYDQDEHEWVLVVDGRAAVEFEGQADMVELRRGSYLNIPAHARHRVAWTDPNTRTVWLAIFYRD